MHGGQLLGDHTRIAAQIIPGIGFIGAGSILHNRDNLVTGITSAATLFVVASVGMAVGGGLYLTAVFATALILLCLFLLGNAEQKFNLKLAVHSYEVTGSSADRHQGRSESRPGVYPRHDGERSGGRDPAACAAAV